MPEGTGTIERVPLFIDPEFEALCPKLSAGKETDELELLEASIQAEGCREAIRYWACDDKFIIIDGHNRYRICSRLGLHYDVVEMHFADRRAAMSWIAGNQLARRNLTPVMRAMLLTRWCELRANEPGNAVDAVSADAGVPKRTLYRAKEVARSIDKLGLKSTALKEAAMEGRIRRADAEVLADAPKEVLQALEAEPTPTLKTTAREAADAIRERRATQAVKDGMVVTLPAMAAFEKLLGKCVRAKSEALEACGGKQAEWAFAHHEEIRHYLNCIFDEWIAWKRELAERQKLVA
jgi:ParB-like chromosome segregation protein Spo0J